MTNDRGHSWVYEQLVVEGREAAQPNEQPWPAVLPGHGHRQYSGTRVVCNGEAQGAEQFKSKEIGTMVTLGVF